MEQELTYREVNGYKLPNLALPDDGLGEEIHIGIWGQRRLDYLKRHKRALYSSLLTSGKLRAHSLSLVGNTACRTLREYNVDLAIFSCKGLDRDRGVTESNEPEAVVKQIMASQAKRTVLLADHTKFDQVVLAKTLGWEEIDCVITDVQPARKWVELFKKNDIQLIC